MDETRPSGGRWPTTNYVAEALSRSVWRDRPASPEWIARECGRGGTAAFYAGKPGDRYGDLALVERVGTKGGYSVWRVRCDCGTEEVRQIRVLNLAARNGRHSACRRCRYEVRRARYARKMELLAEAYRRQWVDYGTLYLDGQVEWLRSATVGALEAEFGELEEPPFDVAIHAGFLEERPEVPGLLDR